MSIPQSCPSINLLQKTAIDIGIELEELEMESRTWNVLQSYLRDIDSLSEEVRGINEDLREMLYDYWVKFENAEAEIKELYSDIDLLKEELDYIKVGRLE